MRPLAEGVESRSCSRCFGRASLSRNAMEFMNDSCLCWMKDSIEQEPIKL